MRFLRYISYLFYSYYSKGVRRNVAYLSSIFAVTLIFYLNILIVVILLKLDNYIPIEPNEGKSTQYFKLALFMSPVFFFLYYGVKEKKLLELKDRLGYNHFNKKFNHRVLLFVYIAVALAVLMTLAIMRKSSI